MMKKTAKIDQTTKTQKGLNTREALSVLNKWSKSILLWDVENYNIHNMLPKVLQQANFSVALPKSVSGCILCAPVRALSAGISGFVLGLQRFFFFFCCQCGCIQLWQAAWLHTGISKAWSVPQEWSCTESRLTLVFTSSLELPIYRGHKGSPKQWPWNGSQPVARQQYSPTFYVSRETDLF